MLKLCFPDGNEYELAQIDTDLYTILDTKEYPNFAVVNIVEGRPQGLFGRDKKAYTYRAIRFNSKYYGAKLINKEQI